jgi:hypothetical protein
MPSNDGLETPFGMPQAQVHTHQSFFPPHVQRDNRFNWPLAYPSFETSGRAGALDAQHHQPPVHTASSPFQFSLHNRPPPVQDWTVTSPPPQQAANPIGQISGQMGPLDRQSARKQEAFRRKAAAQSSKKRPASQALDRPVKEGKDKAAKLGVGSLKRAGKQKSQLADGPAPQDTHFPNIVSDYAINHQPLAQPYNYNQASRLPPGHDPGFPPAPPGWGDNVWPPPGYVLVPLDEGFQMPPPVAARVQPPNAFLEAQEVHQANPQQFVPPVRNAYGLAAPKQIYTEQRGQPIVDEYDAYKLSVQLYQIDPSVTKSAFAQAWLETSIFEKLDQSVKCFIHCTNGFIGGNAGPLHFVVLHNASNPFRSGSLPTSTTTIGVYGLYWKEDKTILWKTFAPDICNQLRKAEANGAISVAQKWAPDMKATEKRFHRAYWKSANLLPLQNLLNHSNRSLAVEEAAPDSEDDFEMSEADVRNDDLGLEWSESAAAWERVLQVLKEYAPQRDHGEEHRILWSSEWGVADSARGGMTPWG